MPPPESLRAWARTPMPVRRPPAVPIRPLASFGWALAGVLGLALSLPPVGFYPLAWVGLVPLLVRWSAMTEWRICARETYALFLVLSAATGFWSLFEPTTGAAVLGLAMLVAVPLPLVAAFAVSTVVRRRFGLGAGLAVLVADLLALEFLALRLDAGVPWLLLGHTQVEALPFLQTADLGGVLLLSAWVLLLNVTGLLAVPVRRLSAEGVAAWDWGSTGVAVALVAVLVAVPSVYGAVRAHQAEAPTGFARLGVVQPGMSALAWEAHGGAARVDHLAALSDRLVERWVAERAAPGTALDGRPLDGRPLGARPSAAERWAAARPVAASAAASGGLLVWPHDALPSVGTAEREDVLVGRLQRWCALRGVSLLTGAQTLATDGTSPRTSALYVTAAQGLARRTAQTRAAPTPDAPTLFTNGGIRVAALVGAEARSGGLARRHAEDGASLFVVLARGGAAGGEGAHARDLALTRLRAVETRRAVVVTSASGATSLVSPSGQTDRLAGWMEQGLIPLDVPTHRASTLYVRHGDWLGRWALAFALALHLGLAAYAFVRPAPNRLRAGAQTFTGGQPVGR